ncbi:hypothetical protein ACFSUK_33385 [Sphingobium scionense]
MQFPTLDKDQRRILQMLRKSGPLSRSALAAGLEISGTALTRLSRDLIGLNLVEEVPGAEAQGRGRPAIPCAWRAMAAMRSAPRRTRASSILPWSISPAPPSPPIMRPSRRSIPRALRARCGG